MLARKCVRERERESIGIVSDGSEKSLHTYIRYVRAIGERECVGIITRKDARDFMFVSVFRSVYVLQLTMIENVFAEKERKKERKKEAEAERGSEGVIMDVKWPLREVVGVSCPKRDLEIDGFEGNMRRSSKSEEKWLQMLEEKKKVLKTFFVPKTCDG